MTALAAQLHLALVDDHLAQEGARVADRLAVALADPRGGRGDLEEVAERVAPARAGHAQRPGERHEQRVLKLAVTGEPGARFTALWNCCRAHASLPREKCWNVGAAGETAGDQPGRAGRRAGGRAHESVTPGLLDPFAIGQVGVAMRGAHLE